MQSITVNLTNVLTTGAFLGFGYIIYLFKTSDTSLLTRNVSLNTTVFKAEDLKPNDLLVMTMPDASPKDIREVERRLNDLGAANAVVTNKPIEQFKKSQVDLNPDENLKERKP